MIGSEIAIDFENSKNFWYLAWINGKALIAFTSKSETCLCFQTFGTLRASLNDDRGGDYGDRDIKHLCLSYRY